jgi:hypothetical protein
MGTGYERFACYRCGIGKVNEPSRPTTTFMKPLRIAASSTLLSTPCLNTSQRAESTTDSEKRVKRGTVLRYTTPVSPKNSTGVLKMQEKHYRLANKTSCSGVISEVHLHRRGVKVSLASHQK